MAEIEVPELPERLGGNALLTVVLIAIASLMTGWCAFQSAVWGGRQAVYIMHVDRDNVQATEAHLRATQLILLDVAMFLRWMEADHLHHTELADLYAQRFRPELRTAFDAWRAASLRDPAHAPTSPLAMPEYQSVDRQRGAALAEAARVASIEAVTFNRMSDQYALMTVLFSMVNVMAGVAQKLRDRRASVALFAITMLFLLASVVRVLLLPASGVA